MSRRHKHKWEMARAIWPYEPGWVWLCDGRRSGCGLYDYIVMGDVPKPVDAKSPPIQEPQT